MHDRATGPDEAPCVPPARLSDLHNGSDPELMWAVEVLVALVAEPAVIHPQWSNYVRPGRDPDM